MDKQEMYRFSHENWETYRNLEEIIKKDEKGWEIEKSRISLFWMNKEKKLKDHYLFMIQAQESTILEVKMKSQRAVERC